MRSYNSKKKKEGPEESFKKFMNELQEVESYDFIKEESLFSQEILEKILSKFCDIIAKALDCQSCTINLQMYDSKLMGKNLINKNIIEYLLKTQLLETLENIANTIANADRKERIKIENNKLKEVLERYLNSPHNNEEAGEEFGKALRELLNPHLKEEDQDKNIPMHLKEFIDYRVNLLKSPLTFPYWEYGKGVSSLVATNEKSPWTQLLDNKNNRLIYVSLFSGISKNIYQENVAKVRDRLNIRETRNFRKLGLADMIVWNNSGWDYVFKNYYGVPVRIHPGGEVIGIMKAENKKAAGEEKIIHWLMKSKNAKELIKNIIQKVEEKLEGNKDIDSLNVSLLSMAYLQRDLESAERSGAYKMEELLFIPYPDYIIREAKKKTPGNSHGTDRYRHLKINSLIPPEDNKRPPMQLFTGSIEDEKKLLKLMARRFSKKMYDKIMRLYELFFKEIYKNISYREQKAKYRVDKTHLQSGIQEIFYGKKPISIDIKSWQETQKLPDFHFRVSLRSGPNSDQDIDLYIVALPTKAEIRTGQIPEDHKYKIVNRIWLSGNEETSMQDFCKHRETFTEQALGELVLFDNSKEIKITDLIIDRLAARSQAFANAFPIAKFTPDDTYKLTWASFEIGKLIEREISYRANKHNDPIPLTAMEFYRIPISDLNFIDDLRHRRTKLKKIADNIDVHLKHIISQMGITDSVEYSSRIKDYRSWLQRIGERFEAYIRGNIALWVFLLSLIIEEQDKKKLKENQQLDKKDLKQFLNSLKVFGENVKILLDDHEFSLFNTFSKKNKSMKFWGDLKFDSPPFLVEKRLNDLYEAHKKCHKACRSFKSSEMESIKAGIKGVKKVLESILIDETLVEEIEKLYKEFSQYLDDFLKNRDPNFLELTQKIVEKLLLIELKHNTDWLHQAKQDMENIQKSYNPRSFGSYRKNIKKLQGKLENEIRMIGSFKTLNCLFNEITAFHKSPEPEQMVVKIKNRLEEAREALKKWISYELAEHDEMLKQALERLSVNLEKEGLDITFPENINDLTSIENFYKNNRKTFHKLLLGDYSVYSRDSLSLLIQIVNLLKSSYGKPVEAKIENFKYYQDFYIKCHELRKFLCLPSQQLEGKEKYQLEKMFGIEEDEDKKNSGWRKIREFINKYRTKILFNGNDRINYLHLTPRTIYKRIRMLNNVLRHQVPAAVLEWELERFDLYGTRMNCLFKNQVFSIFENIWNRGDPFFSYEPLARNFGEYYRDDAKLDTDKYRQRWLCLRTNLKEGEYNALQIAALIDPNTVDLGYWENISNYNLKRVQHVMGKIFNKFERLTAQKYRYYSWHRHLIGEYYSQWFKYNTHFLQGESLDKKSQEEEKYFGFKLFAGIIDLLMMAISCIIDYRNQKGKNSRYGMCEKTLDQITRELQKKRLIQNSFFNIITAIYWVILCGVHYSNKIKEEFTDADIFSKTQFTCFCQRTDIFDEVVKLDNDISAELLKTRGFTDANIWEIFNLDTPDIKKILKTIKLKSRPRKELEIFLNRTIGLAKVSKKYKRTPHGVFCCDVKKGGKCILYKWSIGILDTLAKIKNGANLHDKKILNRIKALLENEQTYFENLIKEDRISAFQMPMFFLNIHQKDSLGYKILCNFKGLLIELEEKLKRGKGAEFPITHWEKIYRILEYVRREQRSYLFDRGDKTKNHAGLWLREKEEILWRIKNYVLLFSETEDIEESNKNEFLGWNAHDLYYYIRSLIPMEIQVRTELTNTFAVQYHDDIYKTQTHTGTEFIHTMMKNAGESLDKIDRELEIDYEDYILKSRHLKKGKE
jgi:ppGpp synthetase/RelA/SpoT-type nucleotidyltranferase